MTTCHISFETLLDFVEDRLDRKSADRVSAHLSQGCDMCVERTHWIRQIGPSIAAASEVRPTYPPHSVLEKAKRLARKSSKEHSRRSIPQLIAELLFDASRPIAFAGTRSLSFRENQRIYAAPDHFIDIWEEKQPDGRWYQIGQVLSRKSREPLDQTEVTLQDVNGKVCYATLQGTEFHFPNTDPGVYQLSVLMPECILHVPSARVGQ